jgi:hypothetical protein
VSWTTWHRSRYASFLPAKYLNCSPWNRKTEVSRFSLLDSKRSLRQSDRRRSGDPPQSFSGNASPWSPSTVCPDSQRYGNHQRLDIEPSRAGARLHWGPGIPRQSAAHHDPSDCSSRRASGCAPSASGTGVGRFSAPRAPPWAIIFHALGAADKHRQSGWMIAT